MTTEEPIDTPTDATGDAPGDAPAAAPTDPPDEPSTRGRRSPRVHRSAVAVVLVWAYGFGCAVLAALPLLGTPRVLYGGHVDGDAPLAEPGGLALADLLTGRGAVSLAAAVPASATLLVLTALLGHLPLGALLAHLEQQARGVRGGARQLGVAYRRAFMAFFPMVGITALSLAAQGAAAALGLVGSEALGGALAGKLDDRAITLVSALPWLPAVVLLFTARVLTDLAYVHLFVQRGTLLRALRGAMQALRARTLATLGPALLAYGAGAAAVAIAIAAVGLLGVPRSPWPMLLAHQAALLAKVAFRAVWLAYAVRTAHALRDKARDAQA